MNDLLSDRNIATVMAKFAGQLGGKAQRKEAQKALERICRLRYDPRLWSEAFSNHGVTPEFVIARLKDIAENDKSGANQIAALGKLLKLAESLAPAWEKVAEQYQLKDNMPDGRRPDAAAPAENVSAETKKALSEDFKLRGVG